MFSYILKGHMATLGDGERDLFVVVFLRQPSVDDQTSGRVQVLLNFIVNNNEKKKVKSFLNMIYISEKKFISTWKKCFIL